MYNGLLVFLQQDMSDLYASPSRYRLEEAKRQ